jgi:hypothetical protein
MGTPVGWYFILRPFASLGLAFRAQHEGSTFRPLHPFLSSSMP